MTVDNIRRLFSVTVEHKRQYDDVTRCLCVFLVVIACHIFSVRINAMQSCSVTEETNELLDVRYSFSIEYHQFIQFEKVSIWSVVDVSSLSNKYTIHCDIQCYARPVRYHHHHPPLHRHHLHPYDYRIRRRHSWAENRWSEFNWWNENSITRMMAIVEPIIAPHHTSLAWCLWSMIRVNEQYNANAKHIICNTGTNSRLGSVSLKRACI